MSSHIDQDPKQDRHDTVQIYVEEYQLRDSVFLILFSHIYLFHFEVGRANYAPTKAPPGLKVHT